MNDDYDYDEDEGNFKSPEEVKAMVFIILFGIVYIVVAILVSM